MASARPDRIQRQAQALRRQARELASRLPPLVIEAERVASVVAAGLHGRRRPGNGDAFWQYRAYQPGDPAAAIDWRRTAKSPRAYVRQQEWETAQAVWLWRDSSPSMAWASGLAPVPKSERAALLLLALAALLTRGGEQVAILGSGLRPQAGAGVVGRLAEVLLRGEFAAADGTLLPPAEGLPSYAQLVIASDFLDPVEVWLPRLRQLAGRGIDGHCLQLLDPAEEELPYEGHVRLEGLEGEDAITLPRIEAVRGIYRERLAAHRAALRDQATALGWTWLTHRTDLPPQQALLALVQALGPSRRRHGHRPPQLEEPHPAAEARP